MNQLLALMQGRRPLS
uniref:Uncharacterized protein n=1 Tax=Rhizophora mucronata TaxID=61149 RepID=A0A2P2Q361_RHIMU